MAPRCSFLLCFFLLVLTSNCLLALIFADSIEREGEDEEFSEELLLKPLPDRKVLAHFHFDSRTPPTKLYGRHHHLFPKAIYQLGFLHIDEYPPDANQGFDIPSAVISFPDFQASTGFLQENSSKSRLLFKLQEKKPVQSYTEVLLVPLTTPDFSMPYNVITFTCTVLALYFGSLLNILRRRAGEEERFLKSEAVMRRGLIPQLLAKLSTKLGRRPQEPYQPSQSSSIFGPKLLVIALLVAAVAVGWHFFSE